MTSCGDMSCLFAYYSSWKIILWLPWTKLKIWWNRNSSPHHISFELYIYDRWIDSELDLSILIIDLIFDTFKYSKMYQVNDNVNNTKVCLRHLKVYNIRVIFVNLIRCTMINTWHRQLDSFIIPAGSQINKIIPFP